MSEHRCETCVHWSNVKPDWEFDEIMMGRCKAIKQREDIRSQALEGVEDQWCEEADKLVMSALEAAKAVAVDGSGYYAAVRTKGDFGCVLWSAK